MPSFYRVAMTYPPTDDEYLTMQETRGDPRPDLPEEVKRSWDALSAWDSEAGARAIAIKRRGRFGALIVRYDFPDDAGIQWEKTLGPGHYDLRGDREKLKQYLSDVVVRIDELSTGE